MFPRVSGPKRKKAGTEDEFPPIFLSVFFFGKDREGSSEPVQTGTAVCFFGFHSLRAAKRQVEWT